MTASGSTDALPPELRNRQSHAAVEEAEANARKALAEAAKAEAEARAAAATADDHDTASARAKREALDRKDTAIAEKDAAAARAAQISALIPDLSSVTASKLEIGDGPAVASSPLMTRALNVAAEAAGKALVKHLKDQRVLVTSDADLASGDATYWDVRSAFEELTRSADEILTELARADQGGAQIAAFGSPVDVLSAVASAVPAVLSLFSADRTLRTASATVDDITATASIAGRLAATPGAVIVHDDFRLVPGRSPAGAPGTDHHQGIYDMSAALDARRGRLRAKKLELNQRQADTEEKLAIQAALVKERQEAYDVAAAADKASKGTELDDSRRSRAALERTAERDAARLAAIEGVLSGIDTFTTAVRAVPSGARRSPLAVSALHEQLHGGPGGFTHVLLVRAQGAQTQQVVSNKPLWFRDRFATLVDVGITYMLIRTDTSQIVSAGTAPGSAKATGSLSNDITVNVEP